MTEISDDALKLVDRLTAVQADIAALEETEAAIKTELRQLPLGTYTADGAKVLTVAAPSRRFQPDLAVKTLPADLLALCTVSKVDSKRAKEVLPPALYEQCQTATGEPVIRLA